MVFFICNLIRNDNDSQRGWKRSAVARRVHTFRHVHSVQLSLVIVFFSLPPRARETVITGDAQRDVSHLRSRYVRCGTSPGSFSAKAGAKVKSLFRGLCFVYVRVCADLRVRMRAHRLATRYKVDHIIVGQIMFAFV